jgi:predicted GIY-YIG superfamily endonuclease
MYYVYIITSVDYPEQIYIGYTTNLKARLTTHNNGGSAHTSKYKPWKLITFLGFTDQSTALNFEKYLKTQSGRSFTKKRFLNNLI